MNQNQLVQQVVLKNITINLVNYPQVKDLWA